MPVPRKGVSIARITIKIASNASEARRKAKPDDVLMCLIVSIVFHWVYSCLITSLHEMHIALEGLALVQSILNCILRNDGY